MKEAEIEGIIDLIDDRIHQHETQEELKKENERRQKDKQLIVLFYGFALGLIFGLVLAV